jgi:hypothetical protein
LDASSEVLGHRATTALLNHFLAKLASHFLPRGHMSLLTEQRLRDLAQARSKKMHKSAQKLLEEAIHRLRTKFDVFLSHSIRDAELVLGAQEYLQGLGLSVYVDWIIDRDLERNKVSTATAEMLRVRMRQCGILVYLHTLNSPTSKWMPWELGYFDGRKPGKVSIFPVAKSPLNTFVGQEYLGLYPYFDEAPSELDDTPVAWMNFSDDSIRFET